MAYLSKNDILKAYLTLSGMKADPSAQGATQNVSAIRHFVALDRFYFKNNKDCNTRINAERDEFTNYVGDICSVCDNLYTTNFYYPLKKHDGDFCVGSNFYSAGQVKISLSNTTAIHPYPKRGAIPLLSVQNGILHREVAYYTNISNYLETINIKVAFVVWLLRNTPISVNNNADYISIRQALSLIYSQDLVDIIFPNTSAVEQALKEYSLNLEKNQCIITQEDIVNMFHNPDIKSSDNIDLQPLQQIFYGAPGTGKSHTIKKLTGVDCTNVIRTTFHPDSDYSTFVGAYKPTMEETGVSVAGKKEKKISYTFVPQSFLQAYVKAWTQDEPVYLIIEEINRGNCAQIFGDIFQLLDRNDEGYSDYAIHTDKDMENYLKEQLHESPREDILEDVRKGKIMQLPNNLYIWATMNTSDQSLFPIDSAFKRRWDWVYIPISDAGKGWTIKIGNNQYDWWEFVRRINAEIETLTSSQDKKLGYFFAKAKDNVIDEKRFVGKVLFYLWNDVFKDYDVNEDLVKDTDGKLEFWKFYLPDSKVNIEKVQRFLSNLGMTIKMTKEEEIEEDRIAQEIANEEKAGRDYTRYAINGEGNYRKKALGSEVLKLFIKDNPDLSAEQVVDFWQEEATNQGFSVFVLSQSQYEEKRSNASAGANPQRRYIQVPVGEEFVYCSNQYETTRVNKLITIIENLNVPYTITESTIKA